MLRFLTRSCALGVLLLAAACATTGEPRIGSKDWHDARIAEIEMSHENGEITTEEYLRLKGDADRIRAESQNRGRPRAGVSVGFGVVNVR